MRILNKLIDEIKLLLPEEEAKERESESVTAGRKRPMSKKEMREEKKRAREEENSLNGGISKRSRK